MPGALLMTSGQSKTESLPKSSELPQRVLRPKLHGLSADDEEEAVGGDRQSQSALPRSMLAAQLPPDGRGNKQAVTQTGRASRHSSLAASAGPSADPACSDDEQDSGLDLDLHGNDVRQAPAPNDHLPNPN